MRPLNPDDPRRVGPYRTVALLGAGGMGRVYLGLDDHGRPAAVKVVRAEYAYDPDFRERFARELTLAHRVHGPGIPRVLSADPTDEVPWLATEYVMGPSLQELVESAGPLPEPAAVFVARGVAQALADVHARGLVHLDLKPGNVMVAPSGPQVIDFGIARAVEDSHLAHQDEESRIIGTPGYLAPEGLHDDAPEAPADVFALAGVLVWALTGAGPFGDGHPSAILYRTDHRAPDLRGVPETLRPLVAACLDKDPGRRPTAAQMLHTLGGPVSAVPAASVWLPPAAAAMVDAVGREYRTTVGADVTAQGARGHRGRNVLTAGAVVLALALLAGTVSWVHTGPWRPGEEQASEEGQAAEEEPPLEMCDPTDLAGTFTEDASHRPAIPGEALRVPTAFSHDGSVLAVGGENGIALWDWQEGTELALLDLYVLESYVEPVFSVDDCRIGYTDRDGVHVYTLATGGYELFLENQEVRSLAFSPDGTSLAAGNLAMEGVHVVDLESGEVTVHDGPFGVDSVAFSPGGDHLAAVSSSDGLWMWDTETGEVVGQTSDAVSAEGHNLFLPNDDGDVLYATTDFPVLRNLVTDGDPREFRFDEAEHQEDTSGLLHNVAHDPAGDRVYAYYRSEADADGMVESFLGVWDLATGEEATDDLLIDEAPVDITPHPHGEVVVATSLNADEILLMTPDTLEIHDRLG